MKSSVLLFIFEKRVLKSEIDDDDDDDDHGCAVLLV
jgi:hypothetical protein